MFNAVRMDIYRLIHTKSAYVILVIAMALAIAMSGMTALVRSMATESIVETTDAVSYTHLYINILLFIITNSNIHKNNPLIKTIKL